MIRNVNGCGGDITKVYCGLRALPVNPQNAPVEATADVSGGSIHKLIILINGNIQSHAVCWHGFY